MASTAVAQEPPSPAEQAEIIENTRRLALQYTENLPNFLSTQTIRRLHFPKGARTGRPIDTLTLDLSFSGGKEQLRLLTVNGRPASRDFDELGGLTSTGEYGGTLRKIFTPESHAAFQWQRWTTLNGRPAHVFSYRVEQSNSQFSANYQWNSRKGEGFFAVSGLIYVERDTGQVMRINVALEGIPSDWPFTAFSSDTEYGFVEIDGRQWLLPVHAETEAISPDGSRERSLIEFSAFRRFSAETTLKFE